jgi:hypothetical protein
MTSAVWPAADGTFGGDPLAVECAAVVLANDGALPIHPEAARPRDNLHPRPGLHFRGAPCHGNYKWSQLKTLSNSKKRLRLSYNLGVVFLIGCKSTVVKYFWVFENPKEQ